MAVWLLPRVCLRSPRCVPRPTGHYAIHSSNSYGRVFVLVVSFSIWTYVHPTLHGAPPQAAEIWCTDARARSLELPARTNALFGTRKNTAPRGSPRGGGAQLLDGPKAALRGKKTHGLPMPPVKSSDRVRLKSMRVILNAPKATTILWSPESLRLRLVYSRNITNSVGMSAVLSSSFDFYCWKVIRTQGDLPSARLRQETAPAPCRTGTADPVHTGGAESPAWSRTSGGSAP